MTFSDTTIRQTSNAVGDSIHSQPYEHYTRFDLNSYFGLALIKTKLISRIADNTLAIKSLLFNNSLDNFE